MNEGILGWGPFQDWELDAACYGMPSEIFFGPETRPNWARRLTPDEVERAKAICNSCKVLDQCRSWAIDVGFPFGIVGSTTPDERRQERQERGLSASLNVVTGRSPSALPRRRPGRVHQGRVQLPSDY